MVNAVTFQDTWNGVPLRTNVSGIIDSWNIKQEIFAIAKLIKNLYLVQLMEQPITNLEFLKEFLVYLLFEYFY